MMGHSKKQNAHSNTLFHILKLLAPPLFFFFFFSMKLGQCLMGISQRKFIRIVSRQKKKKIKNFFIFIGALW